ncbi:MAG: hypothetical protein JWM05_339, partial [Acidimicrobiales bacterium]|nr:hypothetical protein [Acidimicrobiales bacterium]
ALIAWRVSVFFLSRSPVGARIWGTVAHFLHELQPCSR